MKSVNRSQPVSRKARKAETRAALLRAARASFEARGFHGSGVADLTREAGVAHGTFYVHFESKEALLDELVSAFNASLAEQLAPVLAQAAGGPPLEPLVRATARVFLSHWRHERWLVEAYAQRVATGLTIGALRDGINPPMLGLLREALARAAKERGSAPVDLELVTHGLLALWLRVGLKATLGEAVDDAVAVETLTRMTVGAIDAALGPSAARRARC